jgi:hypothetical protein
VITSEANDASEIYIKENEVENHRIARTIVRGALVALVALAVAGIASAQERIVEFNGGIGVQTLTGVNADGTLKLNIVRGVNPSGPWVIKHLDARVNSNGHITVNGRGLLLAAGNGIGTNAGASVFATLFCGPATTPTAFTSNLAGVALDANGNFQINDVLSAAPASPCTTPVLLIRNASNGVWFAAGVPSAPQE